MESDVPAATPSSAPKAYAAERWARAVLGVVRCSYDPKTIIAWGHCVGASSGALRAWCHAAHVRPKASLDFARLLRAVMQSKGAAWDLNNILDIVDQRTLRHLLDRAGLTGVDPFGRPLQLDEFLTRQTLIRHTSALRALGDLLASAAHDAT
jgi:hypothetical protein